MLLRAILWVLLLYFIYKFVFDFLLPLVQVSVKMNRKVNEFKQQKEGAHQSTNNNSQEASRPKVGDYIDFEEIKE